MTSSEPCDKLPAKPRELQLCRLPRIPFCLSQLGLGFLFATKSVLMCLLSALKNKQANDVRKVLSCHGMDGRSHSRLSERDPVIVRSRRNRWAAQRA